jgi:hypothetical protein
MTFIPEEGYAKLRDTQKPALYDVQNEAEDKAPSRSISAAATAPTPAAAAAPMLPPVQRTVHAIELVPTAPAASSADQLQRQHQCCHQFRKLSMPLNLYPLPLPHHLQALCMTFIRFCPRLSPSPLTKLSKHLHHPPTTMTCLSMRVLYIK